MTDIKQYPKEVQEAIKNTRVFNREELSKYFDDKIQYYEDYNKSHPQYQWAADYPRIYREKKQQVLDEFDKYGVARYNVDYNHYGHVFDCEDIDVHQYTDGTYKIDYHFYSAY